MAEASDDLGHITTLGGDMPDDWTPVKMSSENIEVELSLMRNECLARANSLLDKEIAYRRYSVIAMGTVPVAFLACLNPLSFLTEAHNRVERMRRLSNIEF